LPSEIARPPVAIIAAVAENGVIGRANALPWRLPSDLAHFRRLTIGNTIVVGRRTHESIGRPLPGRRTIVVASSPVEGMETAPSLAEAVARSERPVFLAGGAGIYEEGMALADTLHITRVHARPEGDTVFPPVDPAVFRLARAEPGVREARDECDFTYETFVRIAPDA
jgi:dihydrofolate reductase